MEPSTQHNIVGLQRRRYLEPGLHEGSRGIFHEVITPLSRHEHAAIRGSFPQGISIEDGFECAPLLLAATKDSWVDVENGMTILPDKRLLRESVVRAALLERYALPSPEALEAATDMRGGDVVMPLASQRCANYCRWWLDSVAKLFVLKQSKHLASLFPEKKILAVLKTFEQSFQTESVDRLEAEHPNWFVPGRFQLIRGASVNSPGLTFRGGQELPAPMEEFSQFLEEHFPTEPSDPAKKFIYVTRSEEKMRRILNEEEMLSGLRDMGFHIVNPSKLSLMEQIRLFRGARVVAGPHGAAFTNLIFCRAGARLLEIFPEMGVHASAFFRISSLRKFDYYFAVGEAVENILSAEKKNPRDADIVVNVAATLSLIREATQGC